MGSPIVWTLPSAPQAASCAREYLRERCADLPRPLLEDALLVATELVTNAVRHGSGAVTMRVWPGPETLRIEVSDASSRRPTPREAPPDAEGGRGLHVVNAVADRWGAVEEPLPGKTVWCELDARTHG